MRSCCAFFRFTRTPAYRPSLSTWSLSRRVRHSRLPSAKPRTREVHASRNTFATKWVQPRIRESKKWKYEKSDSALAPLCKTFNARVKAVVLERKKLVVGPEVTVLASRLARWPHLLRMERSSFTRSCWMCKIRLSSCRVRVLHTLSYALERHDDDDAEYQRWEAATDQQDA